MLDINRIHCINALDGLRKLPDESIDIVITSPPYWSLRDYGVEGQIGLEKTLEEYLDKLFSIFTETQRVLKDSGTLWVNFGDVYSGSWGNYSPNGIQNSQREQTLEGKRWHRRGSISEKIRPPSSLKRRIPRKSLCLVPERFAIGMVDRGWILRNKIVWHKPNHMPSSVKDRFTNSWEYVFLFSKSQKYYFDLDAVRIPHKSESIKRITQQWNGHREPKSSWQGMDIGKMCHPSGRNPGDFIRETGILSRSTAGVYSQRPGGLSFQYAGKNPGDTWLINTQPFPEAHFATFPEKLVERAIQTSPLWICTKCARPRERITQIFRTTSIPNQSDRAKAAQAQDKRIGQYKIRYLAHRVTVGWKSCKCEAKRKPALVLDPFMGAGTTAFVAKKLGREFLGFELNPDYIKIAETRLKTL